MRLDDTAPDGAVLIPLRARDGSVRAYAIVDAADADWVNQSRWCLGGKGYAYRAVSVGGAQQWHTMHRDLLGLAPGDGLEADHINRNKLDNRRSNLRVVTRAENAQNMPKYRGSSSRFRGVHWAKKSNKWIAQARIDGRLRHLGCFDDEMEAARVAREARLDAFPYAVD